MQQLLVNAELDDLIRLHGSPLNIVNPLPMGQNISQLTQVAKDRDVDFQVFFARKSNRCLTFVDQAAQCGAGIDTASQNEVQQCIDCGMDPHRIICTAAVKSESLIHNCLRHGVCICIDNEDELSLVEYEADRLGCVASIALRIGGFEHEGAKLVTRFGFDVDRDRGIVDRFSESSLRIDGIHFHLDGYDAAQRVTGIRTACDWIERLRRSGQSPTFIDMGGGFPISYLESEQEWTDFWHEHELALRGKRDPITYRNHGLGRIVVDGTVHGSPKSYPYFQSPVRDEWFAAILDAEVDGTSIAQKIRTAGLQLRCEPGRSLMDGCGVTAARVEFRKRSANGDWLIGLSMNRTQCRTSSDDFLVDPIVVPTRDAGGEPMSGYLVGAYCTESELLSLRRLHFPNGIQRGDLVVFPNTAGYLMHFLESRSHQFPLAKNVIYQDEPGAELPLDPIDAF
ncbi:Y4yA family PLP-dependent enzyme [Allorhodopirellula solitaria]|uniref:Diaminopimelate decarboxylase n=1 Tax=Allorhodopirellula solitaria TaxID=2527987 RepID=A0A5C5XXW8_9BACT|nr:Y4yA family PLP-dependent enzyme [Allorhodopirellula solitaria]TWT67399.1 Diaminopimelate decarboxylase [Allorhodopirellula solitaria]